MGIRDDPLHIHICRSTLLPLYLPPGNRDVCWVLIQKECLGSHGKHLHILLPVQLADVKIKLDLVFFAEEHKELATVIVGPLGGREGGRERERREGGREGGRERREGGREGGRENKRREGEEGGREGEGGREIVIILKILQ